MLLDSRAMLSILGTRHEPAGVFIYDQQVWGRVSSSRPDVGQARFSHIKLYNHSQEPMHLFSPLTDTGKTCVVTKRGQ